MLTYVFVATDGLDAWGVLGDPSRRLILERLSTGSRTVSELADAMPISRPAVSQHLKVLRDAGIVHDESRGRHRVYSIDAQRLARYRHQLDEFWSGALVGLAAPGDEERGTA